MTARIGTARRTVARNAARVTTVVAVVFAASFPAFAGNSPQGDTAAAWPVGWNAYRMDDGAYVQDILGDENPNNADLSSGPCTGSGCTGSAPTVYYASDGTTAFFRVRLAVNPADATKGGLTGNAYLTQLAVNGTVVAVVGVDGKSASVDYVYTATAPGTTVVPVYEYPFTSPSAGMRVVQDGANHWFLDYQVPIARITTASGGTLTASTPIQLYYGSSAAANLATINKDFMLGAATAVSFDDLAVVSFSPASVTAQSSAVATSGPNPPAAGAATTYTVTLRLTNPGGGDLTGTTATATLPAGVTYVSGPGSVSVTGSTLTWNAGTLLPGESDSVEVVVSLTPSEAGTTPLLSAVSAAGTDHATGAARNDTAPALSVTAVAPPPNGTPVAGDDTLTVAEDGSGAVNVLADDTDPDGNALTVSEVSDPAHGSVSESGGFVTYTPDADFHGTDSFTYTVCDPYGACDAATVVVTVTPVNDAPAAPDDSSFSTAEDTPRTGTLPGSSDPDGDPLTFAEADGPDHGTLTVEADGSYTYTPDADYAGPDSFTYAVCDAAGACATAEVTVTVTPVNDPPPAPPGDAVTTPEDTPRTGTLPGSVDPDGDPLTFHETDGPDHGTLTVEEDGSYTYTPDPGYAGPDSFGYEVCDPSGACASATVTVTVSPVNDAPVAADDAVPTTYGTPVAFDPADNDTDPDGDALTISVDDPDHGSVAVDGTDVLYTPDAGFSGTDTFTYTVCDPSNACDTATVTVTVGAAPPANQAPVAVATAASPVTGGTTVTLVGTGSSDPDLDVLTYAWTQVSGPSVTLTGAGGATPTFTAPAGPATLTFELTVSDGALTDTATVVVVVSAPTDPPVDPTDPPVDPTDPPVDPTDPPVGPTDPPAEPAAPVCEAVSVTTGPGGIAVTVPCDDDAGATVEVVTGPAHGDTVVLDNDVVRYVPDAGFTGTDTFTVRVCTAAGCTESVVTVTVPAAPAVRPRAVPGTLPATGGTSVDVLVAAAFGLLLVGFGMQRRPRKA